MPAPLKTEAVVLRSMRYGEADRILHLYTPMRGRVAAIAKGVRRTRSRFGARLEPFLHVLVVLHEGRGELHTVTGVDTIETHAGLRSHAPTITAAAHACDAVSRLFETEEPHPEVFRVLLRELALLSADAARASPANGLAFRLKLLLAAGIMPQLGACASCGERQGLFAFSAAAGGVVCDSCAAGGFALDAQAYRFLVSALANPLVEAPEASELVLRQVERALRETAEHHAHVRLRPLVGAIAGAPPPASEGLAALSESAL
ncbi:MAG: DNA repair protein RecO [Solirubrobacterales bacterium]|nr:DNA repair protein RecO [Solirubrobacterales bacterium]MBV9533877.1 DNA repair protein RecO [Solirubrobacterales bacterium]